MIIFYKFSYEVALEPVWDDCEKSAVVYEKFLHAENLIAYDWIFIYEGADNHELCIKERQRSSALCSPIVHDKFIW